MVLGEAVVKMEMVVGTTSHKKYTKTVFKNRIDSISKLSFYQNCKNIANNPCVVVIGGRYASIQQVDIWTISKRCKPKLLFTETRLLSIKTFIYRETMCFIHFQG